MRILHAIHSVDLRGGGPIEGIKQLTRHNTKAGHTVEVVTLDAPDHPALQDFPVPVHAMGPSYLSYGYTPRYVPWLIDHQRDYDVVIVNGIWQYNSLGTWQALRNSSTPYCVFPHGMLDPWFKTNYPLKHLKKWLYWPWGDYRVLRDALAVMFTTEEERRLARRSFWLYRCDEVVLPYGINPPTGDARAQREQFLEKFPHLRGKHLLLYLSRVHEKKGCDLLLEAFAKVASDPDASPSDPRPLHLVIAGSADDHYGMKLKESMVASALADHVTWTGLLTGDLKWGAFHAAEAFVLPSHQENFGIAVAEAQACGVPVLISNKINIWREVKLHGSGIVDSDDLDGTERLLRAWLAMSKTERAAMRKNAVVCFEKCFAVEAFGEAFLKTLTMLGLAYSKRAKS